MRHAPGSVPGSAELRCRQHEIAERGDRQVCQGFRRAVGADFPIAEPTRVGAVLLHDGGVLTTLVATFDADGAARHGVEVSGSEGTLVGGDPNTFDGPVIVRRGKEDESLDLVSEWRHNARGLGLQDLCLSVRDGTPQRARSRAVDWPTGPAPRTATGSWGHAEDIRTPVVAPRTQPCSWAQTS